MPRSPDKDSSAKRNIQSNLYRIIFTNTFQMRFGDNDVSLTFGVEVMDEEESLKVVEEATVIMTPRSAKILSHTLSGAISGFEKRVGLISMPEGKLEKISELFKMQAQMGASQDTEKSP